MAFAKDLVKVVNISEKEPVLIARSATPVGRLRDPLGDENYDCSRGKESLGEFLEDHLHFTTNLKQSVLRDWNFRSRSSAETWNYRTRNPIDYSKRVFRGWQR